MSYKLCTLAVLMILSMQTHTMVRLAKQCTKVKFPQQKQLMYLQKRDFYMDWLYESHDEVALNGVFGIGGGLGGMLAGGLAGFGLTIIPAIIFENDKVVYYGTKSSALGCSLIGAAFAGGPAGCCAWLATLGVIKYTANDAAQTIEPITKENEQK